MKRIIILFQLFAFSALHAQNEFAAAAFYSEFNKIYSDAQAGFINCRGSSCKTGFEDLQQEYRLKCQLPLADSGKIVIPHTNTPYAVFYFEPDKLRLKVDQRSVNLRDAIVTAFDKPLYARTETFLVKDNPFTKTLFFTKPDQELHKDAILVMNIYYNSGKYFLSLEVRGTKKPE